MMLWLLSLKMDAVTRVQIQGLSARAAEYIDCNYKEE